MMHRIHLTAAMIAIASAAAPTAATAEIPGWPADVQEVRITSAGDQTSQPALFWTPEKIADKRPLLVGLHTWSANYRTTGSSLPYLEWCKAQGWIFIHPNFRGPNRSKDALGSDLAVADVVGAVEFAKGRAPVDTQRIYLVGVSGGGHMALLMAGRHPEIWAGVSAWCPISDVAAWHRECTGNAKFIGYARQIEAALGGAPSAGPALMQSASHRSPNTWLSRAQNVPLDINAGVVDGRAGSVPFRHSLLAFNAVAAEGDRLAPPDVEAYYTTQKLPAGWQAAAEDPLYGKLKPLFRRTSGNTRVTIFTGGHEMAPAAALNWLAQQRKGQPAIWKVNQ